MPTYIWTIQIFYENYRITLRECMTNRGLRNEVCIRMVQTGYGIIA